MRLVALDEPRRPIDRLFPALAALCVCAGVLSVLWGVAVWMNLPLTR